MQYNISDNVAGKPESLFSGSKSLCHHDLILKNVSKKIVRVIGNSFPIS